MPGLPYDLVRENAYVMRLRKEAKRNPHDDGARRAVDEAVANFARMKIENYAQLAVSRLPPLTDQQREELTALFSRHIARAARSHGSVTHAA